MVFHVYIESVTHCWTPSLCRRPLRRGGEGEEGGGQAPGGWDCAGVPARLSRGGVCRQPPVPRPRRLPAQVRQLVFTLAFQECLLQSLLHQISLDTDAGGAKECVCVCLCLCVCMCQRRIVQTAACMYVCMGVRKRYQSCSGPNHQRVTKRHLKAKFGDWTTMYVLNVSRDARACHRSPPGRGSVSYCCVFTTWPRCAHIDQALGLCSHTVSTLNTMGLSLVDHPTPPHPHISWLEWQSMSENTASVQLSCLVVVHPQCLNLKCRCNS